MKESTFKKYCLVVDEWFTNGFNGTKAYQSIYTNASYETADTSFRSILEIPRIIEYIERKRSKISKEHHITLKKQIDTLQSIIDNVDASNRDKITAIQEQNKLVGLYERHNEQKNNTSTSQIKLVIDGEEIKLK